MTDDVVGRVLAGEPIRSDAERAVVARAVADFDRRTAPETGPAAYRRNLPSMAPAAPPAGGPGDTSATGPRPGLLDSDPIDLMDRALDWLEGR